MPSFQHAALLLWKSALSWEAEPQLNQPLPRPAVCGVADWHGPMTNRAARLPSCAVLRACLAPVSGVRMHLWSEETIVRGTDCQGEQHGERPKRQCIPKCRLKAQSRCGSMPATCLCTCKRQGRLRCSTCCCAVCVGLCLLPAECRAYAYNRYPDVMAT